MSPRLANDPVLRERAPRTDPRLRLLLLALASLSLMVVAIFGRRGAVEARRYEAERDRLIAEIARLEAREEALRAELARLGSDPRALERIAREELGLALPREHLVLLPATPSDAPQARLPARP